MNALMGADFNPDSVDRQRIKSHTARDQNPPLITTNAAGHAFFQEIRVRRGTGWFESTAGNSRCATPRGVARLFKQI